MENPCIGHKTNKTKITTFYHNNQGYRLVPFGDHLVIACTDGSGSVWETNPQTAKNCTAHTFQKNFFVFLIFVLFLSVSTCKATFFHAYSNAHKPLRTATRILLKNVLTSLRYIVCLYNFDYYIYICI